MASRSTMPSLLAAINDCYFAVAINDIFSQVSSYWLDLSVYFIYKLSSTSISFDVLDKFCKLDCCFCFGDFYIHCTDSMMQFYFIILQLQLLLQIVLICTSMILL